MPTRDLVVIGASAGGVQALRTIVGGLAADLPAAVLVVLHLPSASHSALPLILERAGHLDCRAAEDGERIRPGTIYVAPPDRHVVVVDGRVALSAGPRENGHRPAVDVLFRSAAAARGARVVGVVLSGNLDDGSAGLAAVRGHGGVGVVQDPEEAPYAGMPRSAIEAAEPEHVVSAAQMPELLTRLVTEEVPDADMVDVRRRHDLSSWETQLALVHPVGVDDDRRPAQPSGFSCPDCNGVLFVIRDHGGERFRCRVGHAWSSQSLAVRQDVAVESALWAALRSLEEKAAAATSMAKATASAGKDLSQGRFQRRADDASAAALVIRDLLVSLPTEGTSVGDART